MIEMFIIAASVDTGSPAASPAAAADEGMQMSSVSSVTNNYHALLFRSTVNFIPVIQVIIQMSGVFCCIYKVNVNSAAFLGSRGDMLFSRTKT